LLFGSSELYVKSAREKEKNYHFQFIKFFPTVLIKIFETEGILIKAE